MIIQANQVIQARQHAVSPATLPNLTKMYLSASCPELKAESVISSFADEVEEPPTEESMMSASDEETEDEDYKSTSDRSTRRKLQWEFKGLTLWLELEEFDNDLTRAVEDFTQRHYSTIWIILPYKMVSVNFSRVF